MEGEKKEKNYVCLAQFVSIPICVAAILIHDERAACSNLLL
jgi:hypothetical protein